MMKNIYEVHPLPDGTWEGLLYMEDGTTSEPIHFKGNSEANCLQKIKKELEKRGLDKGHEISPNMEFGKWIDYWYTHYCKIKLRPATQRTYEFRIYKHIIPQIGSIPLNKLSTKDLQEFYNYTVKEGRLVRADVFGEGLAPSLIKSINSHCYAALNKAIDFGLIRQNVAEDCKLPSRGYHEMNILTKEEIQRFLIQAKYDNLYELALLLITTGMRRGEVIGLQWSDINFKTGEIRIQRTVYPGPTGSHMLNIGPPKTESSIRTIMVSQQVLEALKGLKKYTYSKWVFPSPKDSSRPKDPESTAKGIKRVLTKAGCPNVRFHDLRHTYASLALEYEMDIKTLSVVLGHASAKTTLDVYSHVTDNMQMKAATNIEAMIGEEEDDEFALELRKKLARPPFEPVKNKYRRRGSGGVYQVSKHCWEGRFSPVINGKREIITVYGRTEHMAEKKLEQMIALINRIRESNDIR